MDFTGRRHEAKPWNPRPDARYERRAGCPAAGEYVNAGKGKQRMQRKESKGMQKTANERKQRKGKERKGKEWKGMQWKGMQWNGMERREMQMQSMHAPQDPHYSPARTRLMRPTGGR